MTLKDNDIKIVSKDVALWTEFVEMTEQDLEKYNKLTKVTTEMLAMGKAKLAEAKEADK